MPSHWAGLIGQYNAIDRSSLLWWKLAQMMFCLVIFKFNFTRNQFVFEAGIVVNTRYRETIYSSPKISWGWLLQSHHELQRKQTTLCECWKALFLQKCRLVIDVQWLVDNHVIYVHTIGGCWDYCRQFCVVIFILWKGFFQFSSRQLFINQYRLILRTTKTVFIVFFIWLQATYSV